MRHNQQGMSLVELMVGILIGLMMIAAATGSLSFFEAQRKTSLAGATAANGGMMAGYMMQRDLRNAGIGLMNATQLACSQLNLYYNGATPSNSGPIAPVQVHDGGAGSDTISMFFVDSVLASAPVKLTRGLVTPGESLRVGSASGLQLNDIVIIASGAAADPCTVAQISDIRVNATDVELLRSSGASYPYNAPNPATSFSNAPLYPAGGVVMKTGSAITWRMYSVTNATLSATDRVTDTTIAVGINVVSLQAQYGVTDGVTNEIRRWVDATNEWETPTADLITRIRAVRFAVVVRSPKREGNVNCTTTSAPPQPWPDVGPVDLSADPEWRCYRYQVFGSIAPLKNVVWSVAQ